MEFVVSIMPEVPPAVRGDPHYLRQILINLAGNAVKFTERGSVTVHVSAQAETGARVRLKFSVRDTGIGIPPEAQARIFRASRRAISPPRGASAAPGSAPPSPSSWSA